MLNKSLIINQKFMLKNSTYLIKKSTQKLPTLYKNKRNSKNFHGIIFAIQMSAFKTKIV